jgi:hypothetical protein
VFRVNSTSRPKRPASLANRRTEAYDLHPSTPSQLTWKVRISCWDNKMDDEALLAQSDIENNVGERGRGGGGGNADGPRMDGGD